MMLSACGKGAAPADATAPAPAPVNAPGADATAAPTSSPDITTTEPPAPDAGPTTVPPGADAAAAAPEPPDTHTAAAPEPPADAAPAPEPGAEAADAAPANRPRGTEIELPAGEDPLFDRIGRTIGQGLPVAIVPTIEGLAAVSADGSRWTLLHKGIVPWAVVDERARVIWFGQAIDTGEDGDERVSVHALDLLAPTIAPARISAKLPADSVFVVSHPKRGPEGRDEQVWSTIGRGAITTLVVDAKRPRLEASGGIYMEIGLIDAKAHRAAVKAGALDKDATSFVKLVAERSGERSNALARPAAPALPERIEVPTSGCEDAEQCGTWQAWPKQPWVAVVIEHACGDACSTRMALWHVEQKAFLALGGGTGGAQPSADESFAYPVIAADGSAWVEAGELMRPGAKRWTWPVPEGVFFAPWGGGWLGGQYTLF
jgi:hypothetical protein